MAIPLKNGADLYNFEVLRMRFHNLGADPTSDFGVGQVYFNTSTSEGSGMRVRIYDGSAFRSLAYFDEIDNRLKLLEGEIDTDAIISNMKEVSAFLAGFAEDASLMDALNGKLDKTGGKIKNGATTAPLNIDSDGASTRIGFYKSGTLMGYFAFGETNVPNFTDTGGGRYSLLHSGNIGEYKAGDSDMLGGQTRAWVQGNGLKIRRVKTAASATPADANVDLEGGGMIYSYSNTSYLTNGPTGMGFGHVWQVGSYGNDVLDGQFAWDINHKSQEDTTGKLWWRSRDSVNGWTYAKWHQIAFTDSNVASAQTLINHLDKRYAYATDGVNAVFGVAKVYNTYLDGITTYMRYGSTASVGFILNSSGNVTIGSSDLAGDRKLYVAGKGAFIGADSKEVQVTVGNTVNQVQLGVTDVGVAYMFTKSAYDMAFSTSGTRRMTITAGGNVGIGKTNPAQLLDVNGNILIPNYSSLMSRKTDGTAISLIYAGNDDLIKIGSGALPIKLQGNTTIAGDLHVTGNIIADGEVSAGVPGEEGDTGTGGGDALIYSQEFTPTTTSITITHSLSATKGVIVQVWEKNGNYWDMVLVDVEEVDTNTVTLFFGKTETTVHKVVIMG